MMIEMECQYMDMKPVSVGGLMEIRAWADMTESQMVFAIEAMLDNLSDARRSAFLQEWKNEESPVDVPEKNWLDRLSTDHSRAA